MTVVELARRASVGANTISRFESGMSVRDATIQTIETALEQLGIIFVGRRRLSRRGACGVRLATDV